MVKTYDHAVIYDGVFYPANTPIETKAIAENATTTTASQKEAVKKNGKRAKSGAAE